MQNIIINAEDATTEAAGILRKATLDEAEIGLDHRIGLTPLAYRMALYEKGLLTPPTDPISIRDLPVDSLIKIQESGVWTNFTILGWPTSSMYVGFRDGVIIARSRIITPRRMHSSNVFDYANSELHAWLNNQYLASLNISPLEVRIPFRPGSGTSQTINSGNNGLLCRVFMRSYNEISVNLHVHAPPHDGAIFSGISNLANLLRVNDMDEDAIEWLRTPRIDSTAPTMSWVRGPVSVHWAVVSNSQNSSNFQGPIGPRPVFAIPNTTMVLPIPDNDGAFFVQV